MFSGIVTDCGAVRSLRRIADGLCVEISTSWNVEDIETGASIACSGTCLTLVDKSPGWFAADVSAETLSRTTMGSWTVGSPVNLERSLLMGDELGGHLVSGHVDAVADVVSVLEERDSTRMTFSAPRSVAPFIAEKGSLALDGVSLTVAFIEDTDEDCRFGVSIIPHTRDVTNFSALEDGDRVNLEIDMFARYLHRLLESRHGLAISRVKES